jgi:NitT/TauT family transport system ATP-binding protein
MAQTIHWPEYVRAAAVSATQDRPEKVLVLIEHLTKIFGEGSAMVTAVEDFSLKVAQGEFVSIVGPSGCGKTTVLRIVAGLEEPSSGEFRIERAASDSRPVNSMVFRSTGCSPG